MPEPDWIYADFNGLLARDLLCVAHVEVVRNFAGEQILLREGMHVTAYDEDADEQNRPDAIFVSGVIEPSPPAAWCRGSVWSLRIDGNGIRHESEIARRASDG